MSRSRGVSFGLLPVVMVCVAVATLQGAGAFYADAAVSQDNTVGGGLLDGKLSEVGPATQESTTDETRSDAVEDTWEDTSHATGGSETTSNVLAVNNSDSTVAAEWVNLTISYAENDSGIGATAGNAANTTRTIEITGFTYDGTDLLASTVADENGNGRLDVEDLTLGETATNLSSLSGIGATETANVSLDLSGEAALLGGVGSGDGVDITVSITLHASSFADRDESVDNTIRYG